MGAHAYNCNHTALANGMQSIYYQDVRIVVAAAATTTITTTMTATGATPYSRTMPALPCHPMFQPAKLVCLEYAREAGKDETYPWVCLFKAVWVSDSILGVRARVSLPFPPPHSVLVVFAHTKHCE